MVKMKSLVAILLIPAAMLCVPNLVKAQAAVALAGRVSSQEEGAMEGVLVSAKRDGSTVTLTVVSDAQGRYTFPRTKSAPGRYSLRIRAAGYELNAPSSVEVTAQTTAQLDLRLSKTQNLASHLTNAEWLWSAPGKEEHKKALLNCLHCHTLERIFRSRYNATDMMNVVRRMGRYYEGTTAERPQLLKPMPAVPRERISAADAAWVSTVNLSSVSQWEYPLKTFPRPKGSATRVILTEYDLPRPHAMPHDAVVDSEGMVWYSDHAQQYLGRLDPNTATVVEYPVPVTKPGFPTGIHFLKLDQAGNPWLSMGAQGAVVTFDRKTEKFQSWNMPQDTDLQAFGMLLGFLNIDGKVWIVEPATRKIEKLNVRTGEWDRDAISLFQDIPKDSPAATLPHFAYDIYSDTQNNVYLTDFYGEYIGKIDAGTGKTALHQTPTSYSAPRRGHMDNQDRLWFGEYQGNRIGMFDARTKKFQEWELPTPFSGPYDAVLDKNGHAWTGGMTADRVTRLNTKTGEIVEYLLPRSTNIRMVDVDNSTNPVSLWIGNNHGAALIKIEALD